MKRTTLRSSNPNHKSPSGLLAPLLGLALAALASGAQATTYDFNDGTLSGLATYNPLAAFGNGGTFTPVGGALQLTAPASINPALLGPARLGAYPAGLNYTQFQVSVDLVGWDDSLAQAMGVMGRAQELGLGTTDGYSLTYLRWFGAPGSQIVISRITDEQLTPLAAAAITLDPAKAYRMELVGEGSLLVGRLYDLSDLSQPLATCNTADATYASGTCGLLVMASVQNLATTLNATFDNLTIVPEPSVGSLLVLGGALLAARRRSAARH